ncbi:hypothetical protein ACWCZ5_35265, partial [Streptomyces sp. NPDC001667]
MDIWQVAEVYYYGSSACCYPVVLRGRAYGMPFTRIVTGVLSWLVFLVLITGRRLPIFPGASIYT